MLPCDECDITIPNRVVICLALSNESSVLIILTVLITILHPPQSWWQFIALPVVLSVGIEICSLLDERVRR